MPSRRVPRPPARGRFVAPPSRAYHRGSSEEEESPQDEQHGDIQHGQNEPDVSSDNEQEQYDSGSDDYADGIGAVEAQQYLHNLEDDLEDNIGEDTFNLDQIKYAIDYNDLTDELNRSYREPSAIIDDLPLGYFDDEEPDDLRDSDFHMSGEYPEPPGASPSAQSPSNPSDPSDQDDLSEEVLHKRLTGDLPEAFEMAMGLWCIEAGISRSQYKSLRDLLHMVPHRMITLLPESLQTLHRRTKGHLPLLPMRKQSVKLAVHKLSTETAQRRLENQQNDDNIPRADLYFFDIKELFRTMLQSDVTDKMYRGMMEWRDKEDAVEVWHSVSILQLLIQIILITDAVTDVMGLFEQDHVWPIRTCQRPTDICI